METQVHEPQAATVSDATRDEPRKSVEQADETGRNGRQAPDRSVQR